MSWTGAGRWLAFSGSAVLLISGIVMFSDIELAAAAGWDIFLALLLFGAIASGSKSAPKIVLVIAILMLVRLLALPIFGGRLADYLFQLVPLGLIAFAAMDLRRQAAST